MAPVRARREPAVPGRTVAGRAGMGGGAQGRALANGARVPRRKPRRGGDGARTRAAAAAAIVVRRRRARRAARAGGRRGRVRPRSAQQRTAPGAVGDGPRVGAGLAGSAGPEPRPRDLARTRGGEDTFDSGWTLDPAHVGAARGPAPPFPARIRRTGQRRRVQPGRKATRVDRRRRQNPIVGSRHARACRRAACSVCYGRAGRRGRVRRRPVTRDRRGGREAASLGHCPAPSDHTVGGDEAAGRRPFVQSR